MSEFSRDILVNTRWLFGPRNGPPLTETFFLDNSGFVEGYHHDNEVRWEYKDRRLRIYRRSGALMWASERMMYGSGERKQIVLRTPLQPDTEFLLQEYIEPLRPADYLFPKDLQVTPTRLSRVLLVGSCLTALYQEQFAQRFHDVRFDYVAFNFAGSLPSKPPACVNEYDFQFVQLPLRSILTDRVIWGFHFNEPGFGDKVLEEGYGIIDVMLASAMGYNQQHGILSFVSNFFVPQMNAAPSLASRFGSADLPTAVRRLNEYLATAVSRYPNAYLADVNAIADSVGKQYLLDDMVYFYSHAAIAFQEGIDLGGLPRNEAIPPMREFYLSRRDEFLDAVFDQMKALYRTVNLVDQVKAVVFDLDNTLWRGQLAEHYRPELASWPIADGWPMGIWEAIHHLRARGILVAVASKNDHEMVKTFWPNVVRPELLKLEDFAAVKINWLPKATSIQAICQQFNIKPKSVVFVDDNPVERASVKAALPEIRVIGSNPYLTRRILLWSPETQIPQLTKESVRRESMIRNQIVREEIRAALTREEFLKTLDCKLFFTRIDDVGHSDFGRALELTNKTNQFNTTGKRWTHAEVQSYLASGGMLLAFSVADKFAEYGMVGVMYCREARIDQFVMSCRVLGMEVEKAAVSHAVEILRQRGFADLIAPVRETPDNTPCREVYAISGFSVAESSQGSYLYRLREDEHSNWPAHVTVMA